MSDFVFLVGTARKTFNWVCATLVYSQIEIRFLLLAHLAVFAFELKVINCIDLLSVKFQLCSI